MWNERPNSDRSARDRRRCFSLIELLVVVAILSILAALLLPALRQARDMSKRSVCMEHLKQVSIGLMMMADENDGWVDGLHIGTDYWYHALAPYMGGSDKLYRNEFYHGGFGVMGKGCPTMKVGGWSGLQYGVNSAFVIDSSPPYSPHALKEVSAPSRTFFVAESYAYYLGDPSMFDWTVAGFSGGDPPPIYPRHNGQGMNIVFVDGHEEWAGRDAVVLNRLWWKSDIISPWQPSGYALWGR